MEIRVCFIHFINATTSSPFHTFTYTSLHSRSPMAAFTSAKLFLAPSLSSPSSTFHPSSQHFSNLPFSRRASSFRVDASSKQQEPINQQQPIDSPVPLDSSPKPIAPQTSIPAKKPSKVSKDFWDVFAFGGPAPETINGRLAMLGFVSAMGVEVATGNDLMAQLNNGGIRWFAVSAVLICVASLVPMFKGVSTESRSQPLMSAGAELWNGRAAMVGLVALAITEYLKMGPLV